MKTLRLTGSGHPDGGPFPDAVLLARRCYTDATSGMWVNAILMLVSRCRCPRSLPKRLTA